LWYLSALRARGAGHGAAPLGFLPDANRIRRFKGFGGVPADADLCLLSLGNANLPGIDPREPLFSLMRAKSAGQAADILPIVLRSAD
ncbi:MAG: hypothetical protein ACREE7_15720, partial [Dongiaceae bacterium]